MQGVLRVSAVAEEGMSQEVTELTAYLKSTRETCLKPKRDGSGVFWGALLLVVVGSVAGAVVSAD